MARSRMDELIAIAEENDGLLTSTQARKAGILDSVLDVVLAKETKRSSRRASERTRRPICAREFRLSDDSSRTGRIKSWNRDKFQGANALKRMIKPTRVPISERGQVPDRHKQGVSAHR